MFPGPSSSSRRPWAVAARARRALIGTGLAIGLLAGTVAGATAAQAATAGPAGAAALGSTLACGAARPGHVRCMAQLSTLSGQVRHDSAAAGPVPGSYTPSDLASAYALPSGSAGAGQVVAIVDAFDDPTAEADLGVYRSRFSLRPCSSSNGCFRKVDQNGGTHVPAPDAGWATEVSLDLDMVSATCPLCSIVLVEASSDSLTDIYRAVDEAVTLGAREVSLSLGSGEYPSEVQDDTAFDHPGVAIVASSGDNGYGVQYPAASPYVVAAGGTSLVRGGGARGWSETAWSGAGSGCSAYEGKPSWQTDAGCAGRTVTDVSAVADPNTGVAVYDSYAESGWLTMGGTSVAAPMVAGSYALGGGQGGTGAYAFYQGGAAANDITGGSNGSCSPGYLCAAQPGYDGPTGVGSLDGPPSAALAATTHNFVASLYHDVLGRPTPPSPGEVDHWVASLDAGGMSRAQVATYFVNSDEAHGHIVDADYQLMLLRAPDAAGRAYWTSQLGQGVPNESIIGLFGGSPEYFASAQKGRGDNRDLILSLYTDILHRVPPPAPSEMSYWLGWLAAGHPSSVLATMFANSHEYHLHVVAEWYQSYLARPADPGGAEYWATYLDAGHNDDAGIVNLVASAEYFAKPASY